MATQYASLIARLCKAIREKHLIRFYYKSTTHENKEWREVEPSK